MSAAMRPMIDAPAAPAVMPARVMPPLVPFGVTFHVVMRRGGDEARMPSSEESVSERVAA